MTKTPGLPHAPPVAEDDDENPISEVRRAIDAQDGSALLAAAEDVTLEQLLEARELLEVPAAELAARRRADGQVERLRAMIPGDPLRLGPQKQFVYNADFHSRPGRCHRRCHHHRDL